MNTHPTIVWAAGILVFGSIACSGSAEILNDWQFGDPVGTELPSVTNSVSGGAGFDGTTTPGWATDGNGILVKTGSANAFRFANTVDITTGSAYLRLDVDSWNFDLATYIMNTNEQVGVSLRSGDTSIPGAQRNLALIKVERTAPAEVSLLLIEDGGVTNTVLSGLPAQGFNQGLGVILAVNMELDTYDVYYRIGSDPFALGLSGSIATNKTADGIRLQNQNDFSDPGDILKVDRLVQAESLTELGYLNPFELTNVLVQDTDGFEVDTAVDVEYELQRSADAGMNWDPSGLRVVGNGSPMTLFDPAGYSTSLVYRVITLDP